MKLLAVVVAFLAILRVLAALRRRGRPRHLDHALLAAALAFLPACEGCSPRSSPGPLRPDENTRFYVNDHLGSTALVTDFEGNVIARDASLPHGEPWIAWRDKPTKSPTYRFTGKEDDPLAGSVSIGVRQYLPPLGRWASPDPLLVDQPSFGVESPEETNPFFYVAGDPVNQIDPDGRCRACARACARAGRTIGSWLNKNLVGPVGRRAGSFGQKLEPAMRRGLEKTERFLTAADDVLTQVEIALISSGPQGAAAAGVERIVVRGAVAAVRRSVSAAKGLMRVKTAAKPTARAMGRAHSAADYNRLRKSLASEAQMSELATSRAESMAGAGGRIPIRDTPRLTSQYGGHADDWSKIRSGSYTADDGMQFEIHAYKNNATGQIVEPKTKITKGGATE